MNEKNPAANPARALFERAVQGLDPATANRLRLARRAALAGAATRPRGFGAGLLTAAGAALAFVLALGLSWWRPVPEAATPPATSAVASDDAVLAAEEGEEEIYAWLAEGPVAADADAEPEQAL
jgi:hypothetical protein